MSERQEISNYGRKQKDEERNREGKKRKEVA